MATITNETPQTSATQFHAQAVRRAVWQVRRDERRQLGFFEQHSQRQIPVRRAVYVTPVLLDAQGACSPNIGWACIVGFTFDASVNELRFAHAEPMPSRHAIVTFDREEEEPVSLLIEIDRSSCGADRWYNTVARFVAVTGTPGFLCYPRAGGPRQASEPVRLISHGIRPIGASTGRRASGMHLSRGRRAAV